MKSADLHKAFHQSVWKLFLVGVTVRTAVSLFSVTPLGTSTKRVVSLKEQITDGSRFLKMPFRPCPLGCGRYPSSEYGHDRCLQCLGIEQAEAAFMDDSCAYCERMSMTSLWSCLSFLKRGAPSAATRPGLSGSTRGPPAGARGDLRITVRASPPGQPPGTSYSSCSDCPVRLPWFRWSVLWGCQHFIQCAARGSDVDRSIGGWAFVIRGWRFGGAAPLGCCGRCRIGPRADSHACLGSREHRAGGQ